MDYNDIAPQLKTGDILLFGGTTWISNLIDWVTKSRYSHVGMVYRSPGATGLDGLYIWQSFEPQGGVILEPLEPFLAYYPKSEAGATSFVRQLSQPLNQAQLDALDAYIPKVKGTPFPSIPLWLVNYWMATHGMQVSEATMYCSELVAQSFMQMGLIAPSPIAATYVPGSFEADKPNPFLQGLTMGPEIEITVPSFEQQELDALAIDPVPITALPKFQTLPGNKPIMPEAWTATVLLHPFAPPPLGETNPANPFFQLCTATIDCLRGKFFSARIKGCEYGEWWYIINAKGTILSTDGGANWNPMNMGWSLPSDWYGAQVANATAVGRSPMNWMANTPVDWWKLPVPQTSGPPGATWLWFDSASQNPVRMMFGSEPPSPEYGDSSQLAFFQMFSFTYFASFEALQPEQLAKPPKDFAVAEIPGFTVGNPRGFKPFVWPSNSGMTVYSTPVNEQYNPLPTRILYVWKPDGQYSEYRDRAQSTLMHYTYNPDQPGPGKAIAQATALLTGVAPVNGPNPPLAGQGFYHFRFRDGSESCQSGAQFPFGEERPGWVSTPDAHGRAHATISNNPALAPGQTLVVWSVLFPNATNYPQGTYLWTWYCPQTSDGTLARPVTFMQSQSGVGVGTSLALNDYFYWNTFSSPIDPANFDVPSICLVPGTDPAKAAPMFFGKEESASEQVTADPTTTKAGAKASD